MAKGSLFLGTARKSVGDITFYTRNGEQVSRKRVTNVSNPRSAGQANTRALFSPASKFYSPLADVLERSFEGLNRSESYQAFLKQAVNDSRINGWYLPKGTGFFPLPFMVSKGTIQPLLYSFSAETEAVFIGGTLDVPQEWQVTPSTIGDLSKFFLNMGYQEGDQVTVIMCKSPMAGDDQLSDYFPIWTRFLLAGESTVALDFDGMMFNYDSEEGGLFLESRDSFHMHAAAIIISRNTNGKWRRSTQRVVVNQYIAEFIVDADNKVNSIDSYRQMRADDLGSDVYLNGSPVSGGASLGVISLDDGAAFTPRSISYDNGCAWVSGTRGTGAVTWAGVKIGVDYLLTASTKGTPGSSATVPARYLDGSDPAVKAWLQSQGVSASVF